VNGTGSLVMRADKIGADTMLAQITLRAVLGQHELDEMLSEKKKLNADVQGILDSQTETLGHQGEQR
jgi:hypothetical protein